MSAYKSSLGSTSDRSMSKLSKELRLCGNDKLIATTPTNSTICMSPIKNIPMILPNICANGDTLVIRISITRELFSAVISVAIKLPYIVTIMNSRNNRI